MRSFVEHLRSQQGIGPMVTHHRRIEGRRARFADPSSPLLPEIRRALESRGIRRLWVHQARALDAARSGGNVLTVTPTASGKTLVFALPVLEAALADPEARALFLYPTKALAQDQVVALRGFSEATGRLRPPRFEIYDGDTPAALRRKIKADPPEVLVTNPDMLHFGLLAHHREWEPFLRRLRFVVLDELHVYRGLFGAHVHHILRRLLRLCAASGSAPTFLAASATIANPGEFAERLVGTPFTVVDRTGAPGAAREAIFLNPAGVSPYTAAVRVVKEAASRGLRTIAFTKARRVTELLHAWILREAPGLAPRLAPYRAGYLPEERRAIERKLFRGDLLAVLSTSALELGIDVGGLDVCVLVGYPGSMTSAWQRIGRVGREDREALVVLIAMPDALDQWIVSHPDSFFGDRFERAVLDPWNPIVAGHHLVCAAAERPLDLDDVRSLGPRGESLAAALTDEGRLVRDREGVSWLSFRKNPQRDVCPRSTGPSYSIVESGSGVLLGTVDGTRVFHECHPGAIYLHGGRSWRILRLDVEARKVEAESARVDYYTVVLGDKETRILERLETGRLGKIPVGYGRLEVTVRVREFQKKRLFGGEPISTHPIDVPPLVFETNGFWVEIPSAAAAEAARRNLHFMGGLHAVEHAAIGLFPLLAISDPGDVGGISYTGHPDTLGPAIFLYDGVPGGAGLAEQVFREPERLFRRALEVVERCACDAGCPSCIQSPRCGNGNKPLDKEAARFVLRLVLGEETVEENATLEGGRAEEGSRAASSREAAVPATRPRKHGITRRIAEVGEKRLAGHARPDAVETGARGAGSGGDRILVFDLETQRSAEEVGGWGNASRMGLALAVVYDFARRTYRTYREADVDRLLLDLAMADYVVGFNIDRFDLRVLSGYTEWDLGRIRTLDLLAEIHRRLGFRISLGHLAEVNLGEAKAGDGLQSLAWFKEGKFDRIEEYCRKDVEMTARLFDLGRERGYLLYRNRDGHEVRVPVAW